MSMYVQELVTAAMQERERAAAQMLATRRGELTASPRSGLFATGVQAVHVTLSRAVCAIRAAGHWRTARTG